MASKRDYYEVLGVARTASGKEIASAYRKLAVRYHPDSNPGDDEAVAMFKEAAEAYEVLSDDSKRSRYDQFGHAGVGGGAGFQSTDDIFEAFGDLFGGGMFGDLFGRGGGRRSRRGADVRADVRLTLEEAAKGVDRTIEFSRRTICETCSGSGSRPGSQPQRCGRCGGQGRIVQSAGILRMQTTCNQCGGSGQVIVEPCQICRGTGTVKNKVSLEVHIPAGVDDGMRVRLQGEGEASPSGGPAGDCYCFISVSKHRIFHRDGPNLILQMPISYSQAALGATIEIPTLDGPSDLVIPDGTQSGEVFRKRGLGMPDTQGGKHGDLLIQTYIETPKKLTKQQKELLRELAELDHKHVSPERKSFFEKVKEYFAPAVEE
jgi:molecular chaperone DnaJ